MRHQSSYRRQQGTSSNQLCNGGLPARSPPFRQLRRRWRVYPAAQLLADGDIALRGLHDEQRGANIHRRQRLQFLINNLATLLSRVDHAAVLTGADLEPERVKWVETESAFASRIQTGAIVNLGTLDVDAFLEEAQPVFLQVMERLLQRHKAVKVNAVLVCEFSILHGDTPDTKCFNTCLLYTSPSPRD